MKRVLLALILTWVCIAQAQEYLPSVPGAVDPGATLDLLCGIPHYSRTIRPPTSYTNPIKAALLNGQDLRCSSSTIGSRCAPAGTRQTTLISGCSRASDGGLRSSRISSSRPSADSYAVARSDWRTRRQIFLRPDWTVEYEKFFGYR